MLSEIVSLKPLNLYFVLQEKEENLILKLIIPFESVTL